MNIEKNIEKVNKLIDCFSDMDRKNKVKKMLDGPVGEEYFTAPASSRSDFHSSYPGGLCQHSLNVFKNLKKLVDALEQNLYSMEKICFVGLFHDLGKVGDGKNPRYIQHDSSWHIKKGINYYTNPDMKWLPTSEAGLFILQDYGIRLDYDEYLSIRLNDGMYADENRVYAMKESKLSLLTHWADMMSVMDEK